MSYLTPQGMRNAQRATPMTIQLSSDFRYFLSLLLERDFSVEGMAGRVGSDFGISRTAAREWVNDSLSYAIRYRIVHPITLQSTSVANNVRIRLTTPGAWLRAVALGAPSQSIPY